MINKEALAFVELKNTTFATYDGALKTVFSGKCLYSKETGELFKKTSYNQDEIVQTPHKFLVAPDNEQNTINKATNEDLSTFIAVLPPLNQLHVTNSGKAFWCVWEQ